MITVGAYLARRLKQLGVNHLFGLPGDFNLALLDEMTPMIDWVGSTNELNAAYAADGYARRRGLGALVTTYGVGELSAFNGIAGSAAESVPVVHIVGSPATTSVAAHSLLHHTLADGDFDRFARAYDEVVAGAATLSAHNAPRQIDDLLQLALVHQKPVYLRVPADIAVATVPAAPLQTPLIRAEQSQAASLDRFGAELRSVMSESSPRVGTGGIVVLVGHLARRLDLATQIGQLADTGRVRVATLLDAKGLIDEAHPAALGTYIGALTADADVRSAIEEAHTVITIGTVLSDLLTGMFSHRLGRGAIVSLERSRARINHLEFDGVALGDGTAVLLAVLEQDVRPPVAVSWQTPVAEHSVTDGREFDSDAVGELTQQQLWAEVQDWLPQGTPVVADAGTSYYGAAGLRMTGGTELIGQPIWSSIGYTLPATLGVGLAGGPRPVLFIGDGAAQLTVQELATFGTQDVNPIIVLINNGGYTVERVIRSPHASYQDVSLWDWKALVESLLPDHPTLTRVARSASRFRAALQDASAHPDHLVLIEAFTGPLDVPPLLAAIGRGLNSASPVTATA